MNLHHVLGQPLREERSKVRTPTRETCEAHGILSDVVFIFDDEDHVESGEDGREEVNVGVSLAVVPATKHGVGSRQYGAA